MVKMNKVDHENKVYFDHFNDDDDDIPTDGLKSDVLFKVIQSRLKYESELLTKIHVIIQVNIINSPSSLEIKDPTATWSKFGSIIV